MTPKQPRKRPSKRRPPQVKQPDWERRRLIIELRAKGLTFQEIGDRLGVDRSTVWETFWTAMVEIAREHREQAEFAWAECIGREIEIIDHARKQLISACARCLGQQRVEPYLLYDKDGAVVLKGDALHPPDAEGRIICPSCKGTGNLYGPIVMQGAMQIIQRSNEHLARIHGLERLAKETAQDRWDLREEVAHMSDEDIRREVEAFLAPFATVSDPTIDTLTGKKPTKTT